MNKAHIEMLIKIAIAQGYVKKSIDIAQKYGITPKRYGLLVRQIEAIGR